MKTRNQKLSEMFPVRLTKTTFNFDRSVFSKITFKTIFMFHDGENDILKANNINCLQESKILLRNLAK